MANGENRAKIRASTIKTADGFKRIGKGVGRLAIGTIDAIVNPTTIPEKIETCFDTIFVQPTRRTVDFIEESSHKAFGETDLKFNARVKKAQEGARHLKVVFAQPLQDLTGDGSFIAQKFNKSDVDNALIDAALAQNFVFDHLAAAKRATLVAAFEPVVIKHGTNIIKEGDVGDYFYVIGSGTVSFEISGKEVGVAEEGASFGELALLYQAPRAA